MYTPRTRRLARQAFTLFASLLVASPLARPVDAAPTPTLVLTYPGCGITLQICINTAPAGALIQLATDGPINESLSIEKSLQLRAAEGFEPVFTPTSRIVAIGTRGAPRHLVIQGLTWEPAGPASVGVLQVVHDTDGSFDVELLDNKFLGTTGSGSANLMYVRSGNLPLPGPLGALNLTIRGNEFDVPANTQTSPIMVQLHSPFTSTTRIEENRVRTADHRQQAAIYFYHTGGQRVLEIARNVVQSANPGMSAINLWQNFDTSGKTTVRAHNNLITGFDGGMLFGMSFYASEGTIDLTVSHNTVSHAAMRAVQVGGRPDLGGQAVGIIAGNVLVFSERSDVGIHEFGDTVMERRNLVTHIGGVDDAPEAPSPDTIVVTDPQFAGPDDYRLEPSSAGINTASLALLPADIMSDLARNPRVAGDAPDMGAYELPCAPDSTEPHCQHAPSCEEDPCVTEDPCYPKQCINDRCLVIEPRGLERARCTCDRPTPDSCATASFLSGIQRRVERACTKIERAAVTTRPNLSPRLMLNAGQAFNRAIVQVDRRELAGLIPADCARDLEHLFTDARERISGLIE